jgi:hypothetical protein
MFTSPIHTQREEIYRMCPPEVQAHMELKERKKERMNE